MTAPSEAKFKRQYQTHLKHLRLKGLRPETIDAYSRAIRRIGAYFDHEIDELSEEQPTDYFTDLLESHSWNAIKLDPLRRAPAFCRGPRSTRPRLDRMDWPHCGSSDAAVV